MKVNNTSQKNSHSALIIPILVILLLIAIFFSFYIGRYPIPIKDLVGIIGNSLFPNILYTPDPSMLAIVWNIRMPRILTACLVGSCLSAAGATYQGVFQNPMASPDILGSSSGATFGAALAILFHVNSRIISLWAFGFSLLSVWIVYTISQKARGKQVLTLILTGIMVSSLFSAGTSFIKLVADPSNELPAITYWIMGSLSGIQMKDLAIAIIPMFIGLFLLMILRWHLNLLTLGDEQAQTMGISVKNIRAIAIISATLITAASVSISGMIGWVGLVIPHLSRKMVGNNYRLLMPTSILLGAIFMLMVDNISRNLLATEIPIGILTAFVGAPFFLFLIVRKGGIL